MNIVVIEISFTSGAWKRFEYLSLWQVHLFTGIKILLLKNQGGLSASEMPIERLNHIRFMM